VPRSPRSTTRRQPLPPHHRHTDVKALPKRRPIEQHASFNPAALQRQIQALADELLTLATAKGQPTFKPAVTAAGTRTLSGEATKQRSQIPRHEENRRAESRVHSKG
jgi:hypothetical protein